MGGVFHGDACATQISLARMLILPGNHDINVVDRTNPARLDFPTSPGRRLREMRTLSGIAAVQARRVHVVNLPKRRIGRTLEKALAPFAADHGDFLPTPAGCGCRRRLRSYGRSRFR